MANQCNCHLDIITTHDLTVVFVSRCLNSAFRKMSDLQLEQRYAIKFCVRLKETASVTYDKLKTAYGENVLSRTRVFQWHKDFSEGRELVEDEPRSGRPATSKTVQNIAKVQQLVTENRRLTVINISDELNLNPRTVHEILKENLGLRKLCAKMVPKNLTPEQKETRKNVSSDLLGRFQNDEIFVKNVVTGDETWVFEYDPETKRQSAEWLPKNSPRPKKARMSKSKIKSMLITFFDCQGIIHKEFVPPGQTVNGQFYCQVLERLRKRVNRVRPEISQSWMLHHDNAPSHKAACVTDFLAKKGIQLVPQPPYSPDVSPCDFFLFPKIKSCLKGERLESLENIQRRVTAELNAIPKEEFQKCFEAWKSRLQRCVAAEGCYFEGDNIEI